MQSLHTHIINSEVCQTEDTPTLSEDINPRMKNIFASTAHASCDRLIVLIFVREIDGPWRHEYTAE